jgi:hypothetical protein
LRRQKLRQASARSFGELLTAKTLASLLRELVHERAKKASVSDRYLKRLIHQRAAGATLVPVHIRPRPLGRVTGGDAWPLQIATNS